MNHRLRVRLLMNLIGVILRFNRGCRIRRRRIGRVSRRKLRLLRSSVGILVMLSLIVLVSRLTKLNQCR